MGAGGASAPPTPMLSIGAPTSPPKENFGIVKRRKKKKRGRRKEREKRERREEEEGKEKREKEDEEKEPPLV